MPHIPTLITGQTDQVPKHGYLVYPVRPLVYYCGTYGESLDAFYSMANSTNNYLLDHRA